MELQILAKQPWRKSRNSIPQIGLMKKMMVDLLSHFKRYVSLLAEALFLVFVDRRKETSAMGRKWL